MPVPMDMLGQVEDLKEASFEARLRGALDSLFFLLNHVQFVILWMVRGASLLTRSGDAKCRLEVCMRGYLSCPQKVPVKSSKPVFQTMAPQPVLQQPLGLWERIRGTVGWPLHKHRE